VLGQRIGGGGPDGGNAPTRQRRPRQPAGGQAAVHHGHAVDRREDHPRERAERVEGGIERLPRRGRRDHDRRRFQHAGARFLEELREPLGLGGRARDDDRAAVQRASVAVGRVSH